MSFLRALAAALCCLLSCGPSGAAAETPAEKILEEGFVPIEGFGTTYKVLNEGRGKAKVEVGSKVTVHASGKLAPTSTRWPKPAQFWSTREEEKPYTYKAGGYDALMGLDAGAMGMRVGEKREIRIVSEEAYGVEGLKDHDIPPNADLIFEVEVLEIDNAKKKKKRRRRRKAKKDEV